MRWRAIAAVHAGGGVATATGVADWLYVLEL